MIHYRMKDNRIIDCADFKYAEDCLETDREIVAGFDGQLIFADEMQTPEYLARKTEHESQIAKNEVLNNKKIRLADLSEDIIQVVAGAKIPNINEKLVEFQTLHNEIRVLEGKEARTYGG